jgi:hypothetical protein
MVDWHISRSEIASGSCAIRFGANEHSQNNPNRELREKSHVAWDVPLAVKKQIPINQLS